MPTHTYSTPLYDLTWSDIGNALGAVQDLDSKDAASVQARFDTSGGTREDGTSYTTEAVLSVTYEYTLGNGQTAAEELAALLADVPTGEGLTASEYEEIITDRAA